MFDKFRPSPLGSFTHFDLVRRFDITPGGQQIHIAFGPPNEPKASRHLCFKLESPEALLKLRQKVWDHHERGGDSAPIEADKPGQEDSGKLLLQQSLIRYLGGVLARSLGESVKCEEMNGISASCVY